MRIRFALALMAGAAIAAPAALAQDAAQSPAGQTAPADLGTATDPGTGAGIAMDVSADVFVPMAVSSNTFEIQSSLLALDRAQDPAVRDFAQRMVDDHGTMDERFREVLAETEQPVPPRGGDLNERHQQMLDSIANNQSSFDAAYVKLQQQAHQEAIRLFSAYAQSGDVPQLVTLAQESLPALKQHLQMVQQLPGATVDATGSTSVDPANIPENEHGHGANTQPPPNQ